MARRGKKRSRDVDTVANSFELRPRVSRSPRYLEIEDFRQWHPDEFTRPLLSLDNEIVSVIDRNVNRTQRNRPVSKAGLTNHVVQVFNPPHRVVTCVRRKSRKEVLFAKGKAGRGKKHARPRWNERSYISCK